MSKFFKVSGYWKDNKVKFEDCIMKETQELEAERDEEIMYYGITEKELKESKDDDLLEFIITKWEETRF